MEAWRNTRLYLRDNASATLHDTAKAQAVGDSRVEARGSSYVNAYDNAHVEARDLSRVETRSRATVDAFDFASIVNHFSARINIHGPHVSIILPIYPSDVQEWASMKGCRIKNGRIYLWKAVREDGTDFYSGKISYLGNAVDPNWRDEWVCECGHALHLSDSPSGARYFVPSKRRFTYRLLEVSAKLSDCVCKGGRIIYPMKLRARACRFEREVNRDFMIDISQESGETSDNNQKRQETQKD